jgi:monoamine oxidase
MLEEELNRVDVIIVGGGLAGLSAAMQISDENSAPGARQVSFRVLEADTRLGGRTWTKSVDRDFGGGYVGQSQNYIQYLIRRYQVKTVKEFLPQTHSWLFEDSYGKVTEMPGDDPLALPGGKNAQIRLLELDTFTLELRQTLHAPEKSRLAKYDSITVADWIAEQRAEWDGQNVAIGMSPETADGFLAAIRSAFSLEPREFSFFFMLYYAACAGSFSALVDVAGGEGAAEGTRFMRGTQSLLDKMISETIGKDKLEYEAKVEEISSGPAGVRVKTTKGTWLARRVIVAMSPPTSARINYIFPSSDAAAAGARAMLCQQMARCMGRTIKGFVRFKEAFWRDRKPKGLMGFLLSVANFEQYPIDWTLDNVWEPEPGDPPEVRHSLMTFIVGDSAAHWTDEDPEKRAVAVIRHLQKVFKFNDDMLFYPNDLSANYEDENWPKLITRTGMPAPGAMMPPGILTSLGHALRTPIAGVHWAGAESSREWCGYMDGAVESGFRAATEVMTAVAVEQEVAFRQAEAMKRAEAAMQIEAAMHRAALLSPPRTSSHGGGAGRTESRRAAGKEKQT